MYVWYIQKRTKFKKNNNFIKNKLKVQKVCKESERERERNPHPPKKKQKVVFLIVEECL